MASLHRNYHYYAHVDWTVGKVDKEIRQGLKILNSIDNKIVSVFGSHRISPGNVYYDHCYMTGFALGKKGYAVVTGGGPGIMEAANKGAFDAGVPSIGIKAALLSKEQVAKKVHTHSMSMNFLFVRRFLLSIKSNAFIFYPGGIGTLNEMFEYLVLMQTKMTDKVPMICVNRKYWKGMFAWMLSKEVSKYKLITKKDLEDFILVDTTEEIVKAVERKVT
jgi:uncharacterized protein (TIGR00730 family)